MLAEMLSIYSKLHGDTLIPSKFIVPSNSSDWPSRFHGAKVGISLANLRYRYRKQTVSKETIALLEDNQIFGEFLSQPVITGRVSKAMLAEMLTIYAKLHGDTLIPSKFIVPYDSIDWPSRFYGAKVGRSLEDVRSQYRKQKLSSKTISLLEENHILWESKSINAIS